MPESLPPAVRAAIERIVVPDGTDESASMPAAEVTGELATLLAWWRSVSDGSPPRVVVLTARESPDAPESPDTEAALLRGMDDAERAVDAGMTLLVPRAGPAEGEAARTLVALLTRADAASVTHQPPGMTDRSWIAACERVRDRLIDVSDLRAEPLQVLAVLDARGIAYVVGALLGGAARRTPSLVDGTAELAAALVADRLSFRAKDWWRGGTSSPDPARAMAGDRLDLPAGLPLGLTDERGLGADATVCLLHLLTSAPDYP